MSLHKAARARWGEQVLMIWVVGGGRMTKGGDASGSVLNTMDILHRPT